MSLPLTHLAIAALSAVVIGCAVIGALAVAISLSHQTQTIDDALLAQR